MYTPRFSDQVRTLETLEGPLTWFGYLAFEHAHPLLSRPAVRKALALAIDRDALAEVAPANFVIARGGIVPPALHGHTPEIALGYDADAAREQLGSVDDTPAIAGHVAWKPMLEVIASGWKETLGLETELHLFDVDEQPERILDLGPIGVFGWLPGYPDPEYMLRLLLHSEALTNAGRYANPAFDELIEAARRAQTDRERLSLFHQADRFAVAEDVALIPLVYGRSTSFVQSQVEGWWEFAKTSAPYADLRVG